MATYLCSSYKRSFCKFWLQSFLFTFQLLLFLISFFAFFGGQGALACTPPFNNDTHICCVNVLRDKINVNDTCCSSNILDSSDPNAFCCDGKLIDLTIQGCCDGTEQTIAYSLGNYCCDEVTGIIRGKQP